MDSKKIAVVLEERFKRLPNGDIFSPSGFGDGFWTRYCNVFDNVIVIARVEDVYHPNDSWSKVSQTNVTFIGIHSYVGLGQLLASLPSVIKSISRATNGIDAFILRLPGTLATMMIPHLVGFSSKKYFAVELVGDPVDVFKAGIAGKLGPVIGGVFAMSTKFLCMRAEAVSYVTEHTLQQRYPSDVNSLSMSFSSVELHQNDYVRCPRSISPSGTLKLLCVASLEVPYKGIDILISAVASLKDKLPLDLKIVGEGRLRSDFERQVVKLGVSSIIEFKGRLDRDDVLTLMRTCDLYIQPSLTEGLPRSIIEAMASGAPVIASNVGGIPELVDSTELFAAGDPREIADCINYFFNNRSELSALSSRNLGFSSKFSASILGAKRTKFYEHIKNGCQ